MGLRLSAWGQRRRRLALQIAAIAVIVGATAGGLHALRPLSSINARMSDLLVVAPDTPSAVTIAAIDDATIARYGRLAEWSRALHATAIENLANAGARVIAFDVLFADPAPGDDLLRKALEGSTAVLATAFTGSGRVASGAGAETLDFDGFIAPLPSLAGVAQLAHANLTPDTDGVVRTVPLIASGPNGVRQVSLAYATLARFFVQSPSTDLPVADGTAHLLAPLPQPLGRFAPIEPGGRLRVSYVGPAGSIPRVSYGEIIENRFDPAAVANRPVLIGLTATGAHDTFPTVFGGAEMPGVEVHANVLDQLLASRWLVRAPSSAVLVGEGLTLVLIVLALVRRSTRLLLILGPLLGAIWFAAIVIAGTNRVIVEPLYPSLVLGLAWVSALGAQLTAERAERQTVQRLFGRYVSTAVATEVARRVDSGELSLGGERHEITAMFADIRGFTQLSGEVEPEVAMLVVNQIMQVLIRQVDAGGGIVNKFSGDGLLAVWNVPQAHPNHVGAAVAAAEAALGEWASTCFHNSPSGYMMGATTGISSDRVGVSRMSGVATRITLTDEEQATLTAWTRAGSSEQRQVERARMILAAAEGQSTQGIAADLGTRPARVSQWRTRFARERLAGLVDAPRSGAPTKYAEVTERRILAQLDAPPPPGHATWTGGLLAAALGDVSASHVWRVMRRHGIQLRRILAQLVCEHRPRVRPQGGRHRGTLPGPAA